MTDTMTEAPPPEAVPTTTATGKPRTPSTPGRKPGQRNGTASTRPPGPRAPTAPKKEPVKDYRPTVQKIIKKLASSTLAAAAARNQPVLAADAIALLDKKDEWAECLNALAQDARWLAVVLERAAVIAPGVELASLAVGLGAQIAVNHSMIPVEYGKLLDAEDPRVLLARHGIGVPDRTADEE